MAACGGNDRPSGTKPGVNNNNTANNNSTNNNNSANDCSANPNNCAPNELTGAAPGCTCLNVCVTNFVWNPNTMTCDPVGGGGDAGGNNNNSNNNNSNNNNNNNNNTPDSGMPPVGACQSNADCMDAGDQCVEVTGLTACSGQADCQCVTACQPNSAPSGCDTGEACFWTNGAALEGVCVPDAGGPGHNQTCTAMFDAGGNFQGDNCAINHYCWGATAMAPTGVCSRLCPPNDTTVCPALGAYTCDTSVSGDGSIGLCFGTPPASSDDSAACTSGPDCTVSGRCIPFTAEGGLCSSDCTGLTSCASTSFCVPFNDGTNACILECTMGGSAVCTGRNPATACHTFGAGTANALGLCMPKCLDNMGCFGTGQTCNATTGECS